MGVTPKYIFFARHGIRFDAEHSGWTQTAVNPYDPPLTYGGWLGARELGRQVVNLLHKGDLYEQERYEKSLEALSKEQVTDGLKSSAPALQKPSRKKRKIEIHTSPYLRCVQTAIAVAAGMSIAEGQIVRREAQERGSVVRPHPTYNPTRSKTVSSDSRDAKYRAQRAALREKSKPLSVMSEKPTLRVDPFLGEWLNPEYFQDSRPPPGSAELLEAAMTQLSLEAEPIQGMTSSDDEDKGFQSESERSGRTTPTPASYRKSLVSFNTPDYGSSSEGPSASSASQPSRPPLPSRKSKSYYEPPRLAYAFDRREAIPQGVIAHARDRCLTIDTNWNSMAMGWGDGGYLNEPFPEMHIRTKKGLENMIAWYREHGTSSPSAPAEEQESDDDTEIVIVIITHMTGCNALARAILNQPVLLQYDYTALTLAMARDTPLTTLQRPRSASTLNRTTIFLPNIYETKLSNNVDHLRPGTFDQFNPRGQLFGKHYANATIPDADSPVPRRASVAAMQSANPEATIDLHGSTRSKHKSRRRAVESIVKRDRAYSNETAEIANAEGLWSDRRKSSNAGGGDSSTPSSPETARSPFPTMSAEDLDEDVLSPLASDIGAQGFEIIRPENVPRRPSQKGLWEGAGARRDSSARRESGARSASGARKESEARRESAERKARSEL